MKIDGNFWVVTIPTPYSAKNDICFECDINRLSLQFLGGLDPDTIHAIYTQKKEAETAAIWLLDKRDMRYEP